ncbi:hypothetical protein P153DRAFT_362993 [Dothidotthia symphoricarpi CBS 119687]|uniref:Uncharacterized protein n=1 Tax=Dothidotthia symphoricarpi CBS 119687 TaxID=1392245 RepID=A0A6A6ASK2_9PLEO|nr:uncharacterized protein P153DRAFT_362993 [Dothidotthia symphoricarpi CBS 119687]KAF2133965.1 hypothetical protein P153DRAFT_362993 [Dothidotthia symphoricarpi CBS 119687]
MATHRKNLHNTYTFPTSPYLKPILISALVMALSSRHEVISPGSPLYDHVLSRSADALKAATWLQNGVFYVLFGAHAVETAMFAKRLGEHGVDVFSAAWVKWMVTCYAGGMFCYKHFDRVAGRM